MIPFAILGGNLIWESQKLEIRILDLSPDSFTFRLSGRYISDWRRLSAFFALYFFDFASYRYEEVILKDFSIEEEDAEATQYFRVFRVITDDPAFIKASTRLMKDYLWYIEEKQSLAPEDLSQAMTGYPADLERNYTGLFEDRTFKDGEKNSQDTAWETSKTSRETEADKSPEDHQGKAFEKRKNAKPKSRLAIAMMDMEEYQAYLSRSLEDYLDYYYKKHGMEVHPLKEYPLEALYIGNPYCGKLFPDEDMLFMLIDRCRKDGLKPVVVWAPMKEEEIAQRRNLLYKLPFGTELVVNDWGMLALIHKINQENPYRYSITMGILLHKRRKDSRLAYKKGIGESGEHLMKTALQAPHFLGYLKDQLKVRHYSYEMCGYDYDMVDGADLYLPYYQMNTSGHCTLYARCQNHDRGKQEPSDACQHICMRYGLAYPDSLAMKGRYNTLFGYDKKSLTDRGYLQRFLDQKPRRIVLTFV